MASNTIDLHSDIDLSFEDDFEIRIEFVSTMQHLVRTVPVIRANPIPGFTPDADKYQRNVIESVADTIRLVAPAGSGKTQTMINRVLVRVASGIDPERILLLTYDRAAASSLMTKLEESVRGFSLPTQDTETLRRIRISTLNSFGNRLLREFLPSLGTQVAPGGLRRSFVKQGLKTLKAKRPDYFDLFPSTLRFNYYLEVFSFLLNELLDPRNLDHQRFADTLLKSPQTSAFFSECKTELDLRKIVQSVSVLFRHYEQSKRSAHLIDFDDQKLRPYIFLRENPAELERVQRRFDEVVVDEFQDINHLDFELIKQLSAQSTLVVTGDDDQAIYGFRGCSPDYIIDLDQHLGRKFAHFELSINYRSPRNIVEHARHLIEHNRRRIPKNSVAHNRHDSTILTLQSGSANLEARIITELIQRTVRENDELGYKDIAVLYRTNAQSLPIQVAFVLAEIPYTVRGEDNILDNENLERLLSILRTKVSLRSNRTPDPADQVALWRGYFRRISPDQARRLEHLARQGVHLYDPQRFAQICEIIPQAASSAFLQYLDEFMGAGSLLDELDILRRRFKALAGMVDSLEDAVDRPSALAELPDIARDFHSTSDFVRFMDAAIARGKHTNAGHDASGVALLTYFRSKGRQWHTVILPTCNEGMIPHARAPIEDERRLFYVAMTRASSNLTISYVQNAVDTKVRPSRFLAEAGLPQPS